LATFVFKVQATYFARPTQPQANAFNLL